MFLIRGKKQGVQTTAHALLLSAALLPALRAYAAPTGPASALPAMMLMLHSPEPQSAQRQTLPPFVTSATKVDLQIKIDIGALAKEMGGPITLVHPKPLTDEYLCFDVSASLDGQAIAEDTASEKYHRPLYVVRGDQNSGVFCITVRGIVLNRTTTLNSSLNIPKELGLSEKGGFASVEVAEALNSLAWRSKVTQLGLERRSLETNYQYMARVADFLQKRYRYDVPTIAEYDKHPEQMFDTTQMKCSEASIMIVSLGKYCSIPCRILSGFNFHQDGKMGPHALVEFYDEAKGWVRVDGAELVGSGKNRDLFLTFGRTITPAMQQNPGAVFIPVMDGAGPVFKLPGLPHSSAGLSISAKVIKNDLNNNAKWRGGLYDETDYQIKVSPVSLPEASAWIANNLSTSSSPKVTSYLPLSVPAWTGHNLDGGRGSIQATPEGETLITTGKVGANRWSNQAYIVSGDLKDGETYVVKFMAKADKPLPALLVGEQYQSPYQNVGLLPTELRLGVTYRPYDFRFTAQNANGRQVKFLSLHLGGAEGVPGVVTVKNVTLERVVVTKAAR